MTSFNFNYLLKDSISKESHPGGEGFDTWILRDNSVHNQWVWGGQELNQGRMHLSLWPHPCGFAKMPIYAFTAPTCSVHDSCRGLGLSAPLGALVLHGQFSKHFPLLSRQKMEMMTSGCSCWKLPGWEVTLLTLLSAFIFLIFLSRRSSFSLGFEVFFLTHFLFIAGDHWPWSVSERESLVCHTPATLAAEQGGQEEFLPLLKLHIFTLGCLNELLYLPPKGGDWGLPRRLSPTASVEGQVRGKTEKAHANFWKLHLVVSRLFPLCDLYQGFFPLLTYFLWDLSLLLCHEKACVSFNLKLLIYTYPTFAFGNYGLFSMTVSLFLVCK